MSRDDVAAFIDRWHDAARAERLGRRTALDAYEQSAPRRRPHQAGPRPARHQPPDVRPDLRPAPRPARLPPARPQGAVRRRPVHAAHPPRPRTRHATRPDGIQLDEEPQIQLLQRLAYWLIRNGRTEMDRDRAERIIAERPARRAGRRRPRATPRAIFAPPPAAQRPAARTRRRAPSTSSTAPSRTTWARKAAVEDGDFGLLVRHAARRPVGGRHPHGRRPRPAARTGRAARQAHWTARRRARPGVRARVHLLALGLPRTRHRLDPTVRADVEDDAATRSSRPRTRARPAPWPRSARSSWSCSPARRALPTPRRTAAWSPPRSSARTRPSPYLARFRTHPALAVRAQLASSWHRFDTERYFTEVISRLPGRPVLRRRIGTSTCACSKTQGPARSAPARRRHRGRTAHHPRPRPPHPPAAGPTTAPVRPQLPPAPHRAARPHPDPVPRLDDLAARWRTCR